MSDEANLRKLVEDYVRALDSAKDYNEQWAAKIEQGKRLKSDGERIVVSLDEGDEIARRIKALDAEAQDLRRALDQENNKVMTRNNEIMAMLKVQGWHVVKGTRYQVRKTGEGVEVRQMG